MQCNTVINYLAFCTYRVLEKSPQREADVFLYNRHIQGYTAMADFSMTSLCVSTKNIHDRPRQLSNNSLLQLWKALIANKSGEEEKSD